MGKKKQSQVYYTTVEDTDRTGILHERFNTNPVTGIASMSLKYAWVFRQESTSNTWVPINTSKLSVAKSGDNWLGQVNVGVDLSNIVESTDNIQVVVEITLET